MDGIERIFLLFGKMCNPIDFAFKRYEDCLSEIVVTHSPRYLIDMNIPAGETIFDKINISYDDLRRSDNPIRKIIEYYKRELKPGDDLWWIDQEVHHANSMVIKMWNNLDDEVKEKYRLKGVVLFPEVFSRKQDKFNRFSLWLSTREGVICPNVRDIFTAGGQISIFFKNKEFTKLPHVYSLLNENLDEIFDIIMKTDNYEISEAWGADTIIDDKTQYWINLVVGHTPEEYDFPIREYLETRFSSL